MLANFLSTISKVDLYLTRKGPTSLGNLKVIDYMFLTKWTLSLRNLYLMYSRENILGFKKTRTMYGSSSKP